MNIVAAAVILFVFVGIQGVPRPRSRWMRLSRTRRRQRPARRRRYPVDAGGQRWSTWDEATAFFRANPARLSVTYEPAPSSAPDAMQVRVRLTRNPDAPRRWVLSGVGPPYRGERPAPWTAAWIGVKGTGQIVVEKFEGFWWLFSGRVSATGRGGVTARSGSSSLSREAVQQDWYPVLLAFISVNLGILNLLPILPFDGGHIFFNTLERIRGRRVSPWVMESSAAVGAVLLLVLFVFLTFNDIKRLFG